MSSSPVLSVIRSLVFRVVFCRSLFVFCPFSFGHCIVYSFSFGHCIVYSSSIYGFWLPLCYLQTFQRIPISPDFVIIKSRKHVDCYENEIFVSLKIYRSKRVFSAFIVNIGTNGNVKNKIILSGCNCPLKLLSPYFCLALIYINMGFFHSIRVNCYHVGNNGFTVNWRCPIKHFWFQRKLASTK